MRRFADRHFATIERWASLVGAFGMGALVLPASSPDDHYKLVAAGLILAMALTKLHLACWFRYETPVHEPGKTAGSVATDD